jgi:hypothetical protein
VASILKVSVYTDVLTNRLRNANFLCLQMHLTLGWTTAMICFYMSIVSPAYMASQHYVYNTRDAANFAAFTPISWCLFVAWIIFVSYISQGGMYQLGSWEPYRYPFRHGNCGYTHWWHESCYSIGHPCDLSCCTRETLGCCPHGFYKTCVSGSHLSYGNEVLLLEFVDRLSLFSAISSHSFSRDGP